MSLYVFVESGDRLPRTFDYAASTYEISTSAITRKRYLLLRQGYRSSAEVPITVYPKETIAKGKISMADGSIKISHEEGFSQEFTGDAMVAQFPNTFKDTWKRIR